MCQTHTKQRAVVAIAGRVHRQLPAAFVEGPVADQAEAPATLPTGAAKQGRRCARARDTSARVGTGGARVGRVPRHACLDFIAVAAT